MSEVHDPPDPDPEEVHAVPSRRSFGSEAPPPPRGPGRARRAVAACAKAVGLAAVFGVAAAGGVIIHAGMRAPREVTLAKVNDLLATSFRGEVKILRLEELRLNRLRGLDAEVLDPQGRRALLVEDADVQIGTLTILRSLVGAGGLSIDLPSVRARSVEVVIDEDEHGELGLLRAFESREPPGAEPPSESKTRVDVGSIVIDRIWVHGHMERLPFPIDADLVGLTGRFSYAPDETRIDVQDLEVRARGIEGLSPEGSLTAHARIGDDDARRFLSVAYDGWLGDIPIALSGSVDGDDIDAVLDVSEVEPEAIDAIAPETLSLSVPVSVHADIRGTLPSISPSVLVRAGDGSIAVDADVTLPIEGAELAADATVEIDHIDLASLSADAPPSDLSASVRGSFSDREGRGIAGYAELESAEGLIAGQLVPAVTARAQLFDTTVLATAHVAERGAPTDIAAAVLAVRGGSPSYVAFSTETTVPSLAAVERLGVIGRGRVSLRTRGAFDLASKVLDARASADVGGLFVSGISVSGARLNAEARGPIDALRASASLSGSGLAAYGRAFDTFSAQVRGTQRDLDVRFEARGDAHTPDVRARARVSAGDVIAITGPHVEVERADVRAVADARSITIDDGATSIRGLVVTGLGEPLRADATIGAGSFRVEAHAPRIEAQKLAVLADDKRDIQGHVSIDADLAASGVRADGYAHLDATVTKLLGVSGVDVQAGVAFEGRSVKGGVVANLGAAGKIRLESPGLTVGGPITAPASWQRAEGSLSLEGRIDLAKALEMMPEDWRPVSAARGQVELAGKLDRKSHRELPGGEITLETSGLDVTGPEHPIIRPDGTKVQGPRPFRVQGLDTHVRVSFDPATRRLAVLGTVRDRRGPLATVDASTVASRALLENPAAATSLQAVRALPLEVRVEVPKRAIDTLPEVIRSLPIQGYVALTGDLHGTLAAPEISVRARGESLTPTGGPACARPVDVVVEATYARGRGAAKIGAHSRGREVVRASFDLDADLERAIAEKAIPAWDLSGELSMNDLPLEVVGAFLHQPLAGTAAGEVKLTGLHKAAQLDARVTVSDVAYDRAKIARGEVTVKVQGGGFDARLSLDQGDGRLAARATGGVAWADALTPALVRDRPVDVSLDANGFHADTIRPFLGDVVTELDGRIDAKTKIRILRGGEDGTMDGAIAIRDGVFEVPQIGERFHGLKGELIIKPWGTVRLDGLEARGPTGRLTASAEAVLDGFALKTAKAKVVIPKGESLPIAVEGVPMGRAYGEITANATMVPTAKRLDVKVDVPLLDVQLPQSTGHSVQPLEPNPNIRVGYYQGKELVLIPLEKPKKSETGEGRDLGVKAEIRLGNEVRIRRDTTVDVRLRGRTVVEIADKTHVTGEIRLVRGKIELQGKLFTIERGVVSFVGDDPSNPLIQATAYWDAPDKTRVFADFSGFVTQGKLELRSEPPLTQDEILALILFGSPDGSFGASPPPGQEQSTGVAAVGLAGGVVTQGLNKVLSGVTSRVTTRIDSSEANSPQPQIVMQITKSISASLGYKLGSPTLGSDPDRAQVSVDWRFFKNWSLDTTVGDRGSTAVDVVWRMHY